MLDHRLLEPLLDVRRSSFSALYMYIYTTTTVSILFLYYTKSLTSIICRSLARVKTSLYNIEFHAATAVEREGLLYVDVKVPQITLNCEIAATAVLELCPNAISHSRPQRV